MSTLRLDQGRADSERRKTRTACFDPRADRTLARSRRVRLRTIQVLETDDPLVMADLQHRRKFQKYFDVLEPSKVMAYKKISKDDLAKELEKDGFIVE